MQLGKYRLIHKLATGGMAEVFLAKAAGPMGFEKMLVVKRILPHLATEATFVEMFLTEARLAAQLNHTNIVQIFDFGEAEGAYFIAMEYIDGPNLREIIKRSSALGLALPLAFCARVVAAACEGLAFAHGFWDPVSRQPMNIIHRDISPDNILLSRQGAVKVVDFGIAKAAGVSPHTQTGVLKGKLAYMPPEQLRNEPLDRRADVYALGVVFYELLTGLKPFIATSEAGMVQAVLFELQVPVLQRRPDVPEALQRILGRALAKERERRYPDCVSFQADLEEFILSTAKPMGAAQLAQIVSMMTAGVENPSPAVQTLSSAPSNPRLVPPAPLLEPTVPSPERTPLGLALAKAPRLPESGEAPIGELTSAARPSRLGLRNSGLSPQGAEVSVQPAPEPPLPKRLAPAEKELAWVARVGVLLFLAGGGILIGRQGHSLWPSSEPSGDPSTPLSVHGPKERDGGVLPLVSQVVPPPPVGNVHEQGGMKDLRLTDDLADAGVSTPPISKPPPPPPPPVPPPSHRGTLDLQVEPEALLFLDGWQMGQTPVKPFLLDAGPHTLKLVDPQSKNEVRRQISIAPGKTTHVEVNLLREK
ncbi:MAG: protein kinase domain-containing protein [Hyalangium sp.]|uniref:serine/threonine protein kinase n=1 Tax=Hyalangium sp. TaxID=2028555 RepID=UPI00389A86C8